MTVQFWMDQQDGQNASGAIDFADVAQQRFRRRFASQQTLAAAVTLTGIGLHSGQSVTLTIAPAAADSGITFVRADLGGKRIPARFDKVVDTQLCTRIASDAATSVGTIEHLMAALRCLEIDNAEISLDAPEVPIMDGSALPFITALQGAGVRPQERARQVIRVLRPVRVEDSGRMAMLSPADQFALDFQIAFDNPAIGSQQYQLAFSSERFIAEVAFCRTFGFYEEIAYLQKLGLARGGSLENAIVIKDGQVANPEGLRCPDEFVRHKTLDAVGDLYLAGLQIEAQFSGDRAGHEMNNKLLRALFADPTAWTLSHQSVAVAADHNSQVA